MTASNTDLLKKYLSLFSTTLSTGIGTGTGDTITPASVSGLATDTAVTLTIDRVDSGGVATPTKMERIKGVISGGNLTSYVRGVDGTTEQAHSAGAVVEMVWNSDDWNNMVDWGLVSHNQDGSIGASKVVASNISASAVTAGKLAASSVVAGNLAASVMATSAEVATGTDDTKIVTPLAAAPYANSSMARQAIINGNFDVWQRGVTGTPLDSIGYWLADRWNDYHAKDGGTLPTISRSQQLLTSGDIVNTFYYSRFTTDGAGISLGANSVGLYGQRIEKGTRFLCGDGKKVTLSFWARSNIANKRMCPVFTQAYGAGGSPSASEIIKGTIITLTSNWTKYTQTVTTNTLAGKTFGTDNMDYLALEFWFVWGTTTGNTYVQTGVSAETYVGSGYIDIAQVQLCAGDVALPFQPKSFEEELRACMRYYEKSFPYSTAPAQNNGSYDGAYYYMASNTGSNNSVMIPLYPKRGAITMTYYNPSAADTKWQNIEGGTNIASATLSYSTNIVRVHLNGATVNANRYAINWSAESEL